MMSATSAEKPESCNDFPIMEKGSVLGDVPVDAPLLALAVDEAAGCCMAGCVGDRLLVIELCRTRTGWAIGVESHTHLLAPVLSAAAVCPPHKRGGTHTF